MTLGRPRSLLHQMRPEIVQLARSSILDPLGTALSSETIVRLVHHHVRHHSQKPHHLASNHHRDQIYNVLVLLHRRDRMCNFAIQYRRWDCMCNFAIHR